MPDSVQKRPTRSAQLRQKIGHPVVDADGHTIEFGPIFLDYLKQTAGPQLTEKYVTRMKAGGWFRMTPEERRHKRVMRSSAWTLPAKNTLDRATAMLPSLFRERMDDFGLDFTVVYSTHALQTTRDPDTEMRQATCRALNRMFADIFHDQADRMTPVAAIPAHTPEEAIAELDYVVKELKLKAVMITSNVKRRIPEVEQNAPAYAQYATWMDTLSIDSPYNYDAVWQKCMDLKVAATAHHGATGHGSRLATNSYIYNHCGSFAHGGEAFAKGLVLGGVTKRFPNLNFAFLEGGIAWATELYNGLVGHCGKRHAGVIGNYDDKNIDGAMMVELFEKYGQDLLKGGKADANDPNFMRWAGGWYWPEDRTPPNELDRIDIKDAEELRKLFEPNFYFGCEADDPLVAVGFDRRLNPFGSKLKAVFSSDIGHWDVPSMDAILEEAYELIEHELVNHDEFREFVYENPAMLHAGMNPDFFKGTKVEADVAKLLKQKAAEPK